MSVQSDIARLVAPPPADPRLDPAGTPAAIRAKTGLERKQVGSVASEEVTTQSSDGLFTFIVRVVKA